MYNDISKAAQDSANVFRNSLQYLVDAQNQQKLLDQQASSERYQNLLNQINQQREPLQTQFASDSQAAYINKMLAGKQLNQNLSQLGLGSGGFGISQQLQNETSYGQNINQLLINRNQALQAIDNQLVNATGDYNARQAELEASYAGKLNDLNKYIGEATQNKYNAVYSQMTAAKQYQDQLAQLAWENEYKNKQLAAQKSQVNLQYGGIGGFKDGTGVPPVEPPVNTVQIKTKYFDGMMPANTYADLQKGAFGTKDLNGLVYQPNNIGGQPLTKAGNVSKMAGGTGNKNSSGVIIDGQSVWKLPNGTTWVWNGSKMKYEQVIFD